MPKYIFDGATFTTEQLTAVAEDAGITLDELFEKNPTIKQVNDEETEVTEKVITDPTKEGKKNPTTEEDATVVEETVAPDTASALGDTSLVLPLQKTSVRNQVRQKELEGSSDPEYIALSEEDKKFLKEDISFYNSPIIDPNTNETIQTEDALYAEELEKARDILNNPSKYNINASPVYNPPQKIIEKLAEKIIKDEFRYNKIKQNVKNYSEKVSNKTKDKLVNKKVDEFISLNDKYTALSNDYSSISEAYSKSADFANLENISNLFSDEDYKFDLTGLNSVKDAKVYLDRIQGLGKPENFVTQATADLYNNLVNKYINAVEQAETIVLDNNKEVPKATFNLYKELVEDNQNVNDALNAIANKIELTPAKLGDLKTELSFLKKNYSTAARLGSNVAFQLGKVPLNFAGGVSRILNDSADFILEEITGKKQPKNPAGLFNYTSDLLQKKEIQMQEEFSDPIKFEDAFENGSNFTEFFLQELTSQAGILAMMSTGLGPGATMLSLSSYEDKRVALEEDEKLLGTSDSIGKKIGISAGFAAAEVVLGFAPTMKIFNRGFKAIENVGKRELIEMGVKKFIKKQIPITLLKDPAIESFTEGGTVVAQNWIDRTFGGKKDTVGIWDNVSQAMVSGGFLGTAFSSVPFIQGVVLANLSDYNSYEGFRKNLNQIKQLNTSLESLDGRTKGAKALKLQVVQLEKDNFNIINQVEQNVNANLTSDGFMLFVKATEVQEDLRLQAKAIEEDSAIKKEDKETSLKSLKEQFNEIQGARDLYRRSFKININLLPQAERNEYINKAKLQLESEGEVDITKPDLNKRAEKIWQIETFEKNLASDIKTNKTLKESGVDQTYEVAETKAEAISLFIEAIQKRLADPNNALTEIEAEELIEQFTKGVNDGTANGANVATKNTKTNKDVFDIVIVKPNAINNGKTGTSIHEIGHTIFTSGYSTDSESFLPLANTVLAWLQKNNLEAYVRITERAGNGSDEILTEFLEEVASGRLDLEAKNNKGLLQYLPLGIMNAINKASNGKSEFKLGPGLDTVEFLKSLGKKLKEGTLTLEDVQEIQKGKISEPSVETIIKESRSEDASNKVQELYEQKGADGAAFEIIEQFKPIVNKIVEKRRNAPGFDKQLLTDEIETGTGGILDLIKAYDPTSNVPLAAYINKYLPVRSITASRKILGEEFTDDITESPSVAAEAAPEVEIEVAETKPTERLIEVKNKFLLPKSRTGFEENVANRIDGLAPDEFTFKKLPNWGKEDLAKELNIPIKKFEGSSNFTQAELGRLLTWIETNVSDIRRALPGAAVLEGASVPESLIGTATGVPNNLLKNINLYERLARGTKDAGLVPYRKLKGIDNSSILKAVNIVDGRQMAGPRDKAAQTAKGIFNMMAKVMTNQEIRKQLQAKPRPDITTKETESARAGGVESRLLFSKSMELQTLNSLNIGGNNNNLLFIKYSKSSRNAYEKILIGKRPELKDASEQVDNLFKWVDTLDIPENKKSKHEKLALFYMGNGNLILPEDGYKVEDAIKVAAKNKLDPFSYKNPNELLEKFAGDISPKKINPDNLSTFSNKQELADGITTYEIEDSRAGQADVRKIIDSNWGKKANPWCLAALIDGNLDQAWDYWKRYSGKKQIAFQNNKLLAFNAFDQYNPLADPRWYDRMDKATEGLVFYKKINDPRGLKLKLELNTKNNSTKQIGYEVGSPKSNFYQEYNVDKELITEIKRTATKETFFYDTLKSNAVEEWKNGDEGAKFDLVFYTPIENGILEEDPIDFEDADSDLRFWDKKTDILTVDPSAKKDRYGNRKSTNSKHIYESVNPKQKYIVQAKAGGDFGYIVEYKELNGVKFLTGRDILNNYVMPDKKAPPEQLEFAKNLESVSKLIGTTYGQLLGEIHDTAFLLDSNNKPIIPIKFPFLNTNNKGEFEIDPINEIGNEIDNESADLEGGKDSRILFSKNFDVNPPTPKEITELAKLLNVRPTQKSIKDALVKINNKIEANPLLYEKYNDIYKTYLEPYILFKKEARKLAWPEAEKQVEKVLLNLMQQGLPLSDVKINLSPLEIDIEFKLYGKKFFIEVKKNENAQLGTIFLRENIKGGLFTNNSADKAFIDEIIKKDINRNSLIDRIIKNHGTNEIIYTIKENQKIIIVPDAYYQEANRQLNTSQTESKFEMPIELVSSMYLNKAEKAEKKDKISTNGTFISFGDLGSFVIGSNNLNAPLPNLEQKNATVTVRTRWKFYRRNDVNFNGKYKKAVSLFRIAVPSLTKETKEILSNTDAFSFQNEDQARAILKLSKSTLQAAKNNNSKLPKSEQFSKSWWTSDAVTSGPSKMVIDRLKKIDDQANEARIKYSKSQDLDDTFNKIIENKTGIKTYQRFDRAGATVRGASKGTFNFFIPPSAEDFVGLLYKTLGKGKVGDSQMQFYKDNLLDPYGRAMNDVSSARVAMFEDYKTLKEDLNIIPKDLSKKGVEEYTREQAVRVYIWDQQENKIPGIFKTNQQKLVDYVNANPDLKQFGDQLIAMQKGDGYVTPKEGWLAGTITTDLLDSVNSIKRKKYLEQWQTNVDEMFGESNMNKLEAAFGKPYRRALEDALSRMKSGRNKKFTAGNEQVNAWTNWVNNSVGTIMFLNSRSAILQTLSTVNFLNFEDNNVFKAGAAFANQPQYWKDFKFLFNSDFLKERRGGLRFNVSESEIADAAKKGGARGVVSKILQAGFLPTQMADSFAIAAGGATFYRNRLNTYLKETDADGNKIYTEAEAQEKTFLDFRETAEESQQSSRPDRISMEQAGPLGRTILAFANTPAQYTRIMKKAILDIKNGRGSLKANISRLIYYGVVQNIIFGAIQAATFSLAFGGGDEEDQLFEEKAMRIANGTADSILRGAGLYGAIAATIKNTAIKLIKESKKSRTDYFEAGLVELAGISPPIQSKVKKWRSATKSYEYNKKEMAAKGFSLDSPSYLAGANVIAAFTNLPTDRVVKKVTNVYDAMQEDVEVWKRTALLMGWSKWELEPTVKKAKTKKSTRRGSSRGVSRSSSRSSNKR